MSENSIKLIAVGTTASVIAGIILLTIPKLRLWIGYIATWIWTALTATYLVSGWLLLVVCFITLISMILIFSYIRFKPREPLFKLYTEDFIRSALWRWSWTDSKISNLWCYCPHCDATLIYDDSSCSVYNRMEANKTDFICENCSNTIIASIEGGDKGYACDLIKREISRRIRTKEYERLINKELS